MRPTAGRWVSGDDFFDREPELQVLNSHVRDHNHLLLTGQRRMGKTSIARELGRRLKADGWIFLFADVEGSTCAEDAIAAIAKETYYTRSIASRFGRGLKEWLGENIEEVGFHGFRARIRAGLHAGNWRQLGERLLRHCADHEAPVLLVIDELPIFLKRMLHDDGDAKRVDEFLSWLRGAIQALGDQGPVFIVSGSIGLQPLVHRLGIPDRINHFYPIRLHPWDRTTSVACFKRLAAAEGLRIEEGVTDAVYDALGLGIPHHVQSFLARIRDFATLRGTRAVTVDDVRHVYRTGLLGPFGQNDLVHYETRLKDGLDDETFSIAMETLAEAATRNVFTPRARRCLEDQYEALVTDIRGRVADAIEVLVHDGYIEDSENGHRFPSRLLQDWFAARFRDHHVPLERRCSDVPAGVEDP